jgi:hypothetical protein
MTARGSTSRDYTYPRRLTPVELLPAAVVGVAAGFLAYYVTRTLLARTPLVPAEETDLPEPGMGRGRGSGRGSGSGRTRRGPVGVAESG